MADAMVTAPSLHPPTVTVAQARYALDDVHRHLLLIVHGGRLLGTLARDDLEAAQDESTPALRCARLAGRTVHRDEPLGSVHVQMLTTGQRRRAVVDTGGRLLGLLCLKAHGRGFCTDAGIAARG